MSFGIGIDFESALVFFTCERCEGTGEVRMSRSDPSPDYCPGCDGNREHIVYIGTWLANLAIAAGLCAAFYAGFGAGNGPRPLVWSPGCGRTAP